jgi:hypothetical protein
MNIIIILLKKKFKRTTIYEKESLILIDYYVDIFKKIKEIYLKMTTIIK